MPSRRIDKVDYMKLRDFSQESKTTQRRPRRTFLTGKYFLDKNSWRQLSLKFYTNTNDFSLKEGGDNLRTKKPFAWQRLGSLASFNFCGEKENFLINFDA